MAEPCTSRRLKLKRSPRLFGHWQGIIQDPSPSELRDLLAFNAPGGPVPTEYPLGYIIISTADVGRHSHDPAQSTYYHIYLEFKEILVHNDDIMTWFPRCIFEPRFVSPDIAASFCRSFGKKLERGRISTTRDCDSKKRKTV